MNKEQNLKIFGCENPKDLYKFNPGPKEMLAMSILSDAQELLNGNKEKARQYMNRAKFILSDLLEERLS